MKFGQNSSNANPSLYAKLHTKAITVSKICDWLSSGIGVAFRRIFPSYSLKGKVTKGHNLQQKCASANSSLYAQLDTKANTVSKIRECLSSGIEGVASTRYFPYTCIFSL